jgi:hypothetical protein
VNRPRAADDFTAIRARLKELRRERERAQTAESELHGNQPVYRGRTERFLSEKISAGPRRVGQSGIGKRLDRDRPWWARPE